MKNITLVILLSMIISSSVSAQDMPKLGDIWNGNINSENKLYIFKYGFVNTSDIMSNKRSFTLGLDRDKRIVFILSTDKNFEINGFSYIGRNFKSVAQKEKIYNIIGWAQYVKVGGDWNVATDFGEITEESTVKYVFQFLDKK